MAATLRPGGRVPPSGGPGAASGDSETERGASMTARAAGEGAPPGDLLITVAMADFEGEGPEGAETQRHLHWRQRLLGMRHHDEA